MGKTWEHLSHDIDAVPNYKFVGNKSEDEFLTVQVLLPIAGALEGED